MLNRTIYQFPRSKGGIKGASGHGGGVSRLDGEESAATLSKT